MYRLLVDLYEESEGGGNKGNELISLTTETRPHLRSSWSNSINQQQRAGGLGGRVGTGFSRQ